MAGGRRGTGAQSGSIDAQGRSGREIRGHLAELAGLDVSPDLVSTVSGAILEESAERQNRPLEAVHPALAVRASGRKKLLGLWPARGRQFMGIEPTASARAPFGSRIGGNQRIGSLALGATLGQR